MHFRYTAPVLTHEGFLHLIRECDIFREFHIYIPAEKLRHRFFSLHTRRRRSSETGYNACFCLYPPHIQLLPIKAPSPLSNVKPFYNTKTLDRKAAEIFRALLALQTTKIDNSDGTYMPVYLELIGRIDNYNFFSLAHYGQQNGDAMRDPEMLFALHKETQQFIPYYYRNDYCGIEQNSVKWSEDGIALNPRLQAEHTTFANQWLRNIAAQQGIL